MATQQEIDAAQRAFVQGEIIGASNVLIHSVVQIGNRLVVAAAHGDLDVLCDRSEINPFFARVAMDAANRAQELKASGKSPHQSVEIMRSEGWLNRIAPHIASRLEASEVTHGA